MKKFLLFILLLILNLPSHAKECYKLLYIMDGDTIKILYHGKKTSIRLLGIDTPESRKNRRAYFQARKNHQDVSIVYLGKQAKKHLEELLCYLGDDLPFLDSFNGYLGFEFWRITLDPSLPGNFNQECGVVFGV